MATCERIHMVNHQIVVNGAPTYSPLKARPCGYTAYRKFEGVLLCKTCTRFAKTHGIAKVFTASNPYSGSKEVAA